MAPHGVVGSCSLLKTCLVEQVRNRPSRAIGKFDTFDFVRIILHKTGDCNARSRIVDVKVVEGGVRGDIARGYPRFKSDCVSARVFEDCVRAITKAALKASK